MLIELKEFLVSFQAERGCQNAVYLVSRIVGSKVCRLWLVCGLKVSESEMEGQTDWLGKVYRRSGKARRLYPSLRRWY